MGHNIPLFNSSLGIFASVAVSAPNKKSSALTTHTIRARKNRGPAETEPRLESGSIIGRPKYPAFAYADCALRSREKNVIA
jgi:hypothetical protein